MSDLSISDKAVVLCCSTYEGSHVSLCNIQIIWRIGTCRERCEHAVHYIDGQLVSPPWKFIPGQRSPNYGLRATSGPRDSGVSSICTGWGLGSAEASYGLPCWCNGGSDGDLDVRRDSDYEPDVREDSDGEPDGGGNSDGNPDVRGNSDGGSDRDRDVRGASDGDMM